MLFKTKMLFGRITSRKATVCAVQRADFRTPKRPCCSGRLGDGEGQEWVANSIRQQNKTHLTQPHAKGRFKSGSFLTQCSCSLICTVSGFLQFYSLPLVHHTSTSLILFLVSFLGSLSLIICHSINRCMPHNSANTRIQQTQRRVTS